MYNSVASVIFIPLLIKIFNLSIRLADVKFLSAATLKKYIMSPFTLIAAVIIIILLSVYTLAEISAVIYCCNNSFHHQKTYVRDMFSVSSQTVKRLFTSKNFGIIAYVWFILPVIEVMLTSGIISQAGIPNLLSHYIRNDYAVRLIYASLLLLILFLSARWIYTLHYFVLEDCSFREARKKSSSVTKNRKFKTILSMVLWGILAMSFSMVFFSAMLMAVIFAVKGSDIGEVKITVFIMLAEFISSLATTIYTYFGVPITFSFVSACYYDEKTRLSQSLPDYSVYSQKSHRPVNKLIKTIGGIVISVAVALNFYYTYGGISLENVNAINDMLVFAHRGSSAVFPENTMPAFERAIEENADYIELDVQETADGKVIVTHDSNLKRITGLNKNVWEVTYDEIKDLDAGSWFAEEYSLLRIPLLSEVLDVTKNKIRLNIEIKPTGHEKNLEESVAALINEYDFKDDCIVTSFSATSLKKIKNYDEEIQTGYILSVAYGNLTAIDYADAFSINSMFVTKVLVDSIHAADRKIYVWTVNNKSVMEDMIEMNVDGIITDRPSLAIQTIYSARSGEYMDSITQYLMENN